MSDETNTLYERLGEYGAITTVVHDLLPRFQSDPQLGRFCAHRGEYGVTREKQLLIRPNGIISFPPRQIGRKN